MYVYKKGKLVEVMDMRSPNISADMIIPDRSSDMPILERSTPMI